MATRNELSIVIKAVDEASSALKQAQRELKGLEGSVESVDREARTAQGSLRTFASNTARGLRDIGNSLPAILGAGGMVYALHSAAQAAQNAQINTRIFSSQVQESGGDVQAATRMINGLAQQLGLIPSQIEDSATQLLRAGFTVDQIGTVFKGGAASALAFGTTAQAGITNVTQALISQNSQQLNAIGIAQNLATYYQRYASSLGTTVTSLTQQQLAQAGVNLVLQATQQEVATLPQTLSGLTGAQNQLNKSLKELQLEVGNEVLPIFTSLTEDLTSVLGWLSKLPAPVRNAGIAAAAAVAGLTALAGAFGLLYTALLPILGPAGIIIGAGALIAGFIAAFATHGDTVQTFTQNVQAASQAIGTASDKQALLGALDSLSGKLTGDAKQAVETYAKSIRDATGDLKDLKNQSLDFINKLTVNQLQAQLESLKTQRKVLQGEVTAASRIAQQSGPLFQVGSTDYQRAFNVLNAQRIAGERTVREYNKLYIQVLKLQHAQKGFPAELAKALSGTGEAAGAVVRRDLPKIHTLTQQINDLTAELKKLQDQANQGANNGNNPPPPGGTPPPKETIADLQAQYQQALAVIRREMKLGILDPITAQEQKLQLLNSTVKQSLAIDVNNSWAVKLAKQITTLSGHLDRLKAKEKEAASPLSPEEVARVAAQSQRQNVIASFTTDQGADVVAAKAAQNHDIWALEEKYAQAQKNVADSIRQNIIDSFTTDQGADVIAAKAAKSPGIWDLVDAYNRAQANVSQSIRQNVIASFTTSQGADVTAAKAAKNHDVWAIEEKYAQAQANVAGSIRQNIIDSFTTSQGADATAAKAAKNPGVWDLVDTYNRAQANISKSIRQNVIASFTTDQGADVVAAKATQNHDIWAIQEKYAQAQKNVADSIRQNIIDSFTTDQGADVTAAKAAKNPGVWDLVDAYNRAQANVAKSIRQNIIDSFTTSQGADVTAAKAAKNPGVWDLVDAYSRAQANIAKSVRQNVIASFTTSQGADVTAAKAAKNPGVWALEEKYAQAQRNVADSIRQNIIDSFTTDQGADVVAAKASKNHDVWAIQEKYAQAQKNVADGIRQNIIDSFTTNQGADVAAANLTTKQFAEATGAVGDLANVFRIAAAAGQELGSVFAELGQLASAAGAAVKDFAKGDIVSGVIAIASSIIDYFKNLNAQAQQAYETANDIAATGVASFNQVLKAEQLATFGLGLFINQYKTAANIVENNPLIGPALANALVKYHRVLKGGFLGLFPHWVKGVDRQATQAAVQVATDFANVLSNALINSNSLKELHKNLNLGIDKIIQREIIKGFILSTAVQKQIAQFVKDFQAAISPTGPGGTTITPKEMATLSGDKAAITSGMDAFWEGLRQTFPELYKKENPTPSPTQQPKELNVGSLPPAVQFAVATPLVKAADTMLQAANIIKATFAPGTLTFTPPDTDAFALSVSRFGSAVDRADAMYARVEDMYQLLMDTGIRITVADSRGTVADTSTSKTAAYRK